MVSYFELFSFWLAHGNTVNFKKWIILLLPPILKCKHLKPRELKWLGSVVVDGEAGWKHIHPNLQHSRSILLSSRPLPSPPDVHLQCKLCVYNTVKKQSMQNLILAFCLFPLKILIQTRHMLVSAPYPMWDSECKSISKCP